MKKRIIKIDGELCSGCGKCVTACHEGAIAMIDGKARLVREDHCDGLGDCLPACPVGAISFTEVSQDTNFTEKRNTGTTPCSVSGLIRDNTEDVTEAPRIYKSQLAQWPCQIKLVPVNAPYFDGAKLLIAADCTAYSYASFHRDFMKNHITVIGCPKLDATDYTEKLRTILKENDIKSLTIVRMEVPCCGGIEAAARRALLESGKFIPWRVITISTDGKILE